VYYGDAIANPFTEAGIFNRHAATVNEGNEAAFTTGVNKSRIFCDSARNEFERLCYTQGLCYRNVGEIPAKVERRCLTTDIAFTGLASV
jgi:hypothetical protein